MDEIKKGLKIQKDGYYVHVVEVDLYYVTYHIYIDGSFKVYLKKSPLQEFSKNYLNSSYAKVSLF